MRFFGFGGLVLTGGRLCAGGRAVKVSGRGASQACQSQSQACQMVGCWCLGSQKLRGKCGRLTAWGVCGVVRVKRN